MGQDAVLIYLSLFALWGGFYVIAAAVAIIGYFRREPFIRPQRKWYVAAAVIAVLGGILQWISWDMWSHFCVIC